LPVDKAATDQRLDRSTELARIEPDQLRKFVEGYGRVLAELHHDPRLDSGEAELAPVCDRGTPPHQIQQSNDPVGEQLVRRSIGDRVGTTVLRFRGSGAFQSEIVSGEARVVTTLQEQRIRTHRYNGTLPWSIRPSTQSTRPLSLKYS